ncbi:hypothetical protein [Amycolatopsis nigrescens]|uniref:hypothetical protein n=1 Tax=Amycolatopsis nigrescens TaxID=381445 RepID=UPI00037095C5|nr:hypothetical protein [Amycolatopsis nigrescens]
MVDVHDGLTTEGFAVPLRLHNLLLTLAGRLDDSALSEARELVARSHLAEAIELATGALIAGKLPVTGAEQRELALVLELSRSDATLADQLTVDEAAHGPAHRFSGDNQPENGIAEALDRTVQVLPDLRAVHAVWRNTPAGSVPGPLPQRVVLVEIGPDGNPPAVAFRVDTALRRSGIRSVVEVCGPGAEKAGYHDQALGSATPVWLAGDRRSHSSSPSPVQPAPAMASAPVVTESQGRHTAEQDTVDDGDEVGIPEARQETQAAPGGAEDRAEKTSDMSSAEVAQLRAALAEDPSRGKAIAAASLDAGEVVELPELDLDDPQLSDRDRKLLRELHAELAERERAEAAKIRMNGVNRGGEQNSTRWVDGFSGA